MFDARPSQRSESWPAPDESESQNRLTELEVRGAKARPYVIPESLTIERWIAFGIFTLSILYLGVFRSYLTLNPDEGNTLQGAQRVLQGKVPYRDFFSLVTPGSYY